MLKTLSSPKISIGEYSKHTQQANKISAPNSHFQKFNSAMPNASENGQQQQDILASIIKKLNNKSTNSNNSQKSKLQETKTNDAMSIDKKTKNGFASSHQMPDNLSKVFFKTGLF